MKQWLLSIGVAALLASCATLPPPGGSQNSLVVGNLKLDYPDGFLGLPARTIKRDIRLEFTDLMTLKRIQASTSKNGYFFFVADPGDWYRLDDWVYAETRGIQNFQVGPIRVDWTFAPKPGAVNYLGDQFVLFRSPRKTEEIGKRLTWNYKIKVDLYSRPDALRSFIRSRYRGSVWLQRRIVNDKIM